MGTLLYSTTCSIDGFVADADGSIDWTAPSDELHAFFNDRLRDVGTYVMGRRMFGTMRVWDTWPAGRSAVEDDYAAIWAAADKIVCSDRLAATGVDAPRTTVEPRLTTRRLAQIVADADGTVEVSGPTTAADALRSGMVDVLQLFVAPRALGGGLRALPAGMDLALELAETRRFDNGTVLLRYERA
ncbi:dihydrofolate reductase family protein [Isoptericola sp. AK164]|uniref:dihydrofolate reductase family protein n=1 Tax=Isoptericola sp. AK164 TaxID=3024246 RepID=UPI002418BB60|nr:dihydrofolate reductase family protein [Isoptericola sp. AK164]